MTESDRDDAPEPADDPGAGVLDGLVEGTTPMVGGQVARLMPFHLELADGSAHDGGLLSLRSMEGAISLLVSRDQRLLSRINLPVGQFRRLEIRGVEQLPSQSPTRIEPNAAQPGVLTSTSMIVSYLDRWIVDSASANAELPAPDTHTLTSLLDPGSAESLMQMSGRFGVPILATRTLESDDQALGLVTPGMARWLGALPLIDHAGMLAVAVANPARDGLVSQLEFASGRRVVLLLAAATTIERAIARHYDRIEDRQLIQSLGLIPGKVRAIESQHEAERLSAEQPVVRLVNDLIELAVRKRASDIHIRPGAQQVDVLLRVDGLLQQIRTMDRALLPAVTSRVKVLAGMNIAERRLPQDGRLSFAARDRQVDLRVSVLPTVDGESVVIRLLDTQQSLRSLHELGLDDHDRQRLTDLLARSHGMVLVTGPTGSGKSTTLYAAIQHVLSETINVVTVENPVEFHIPGVMQVQVNDAIGYTFARSLRNILRHDPDVVMVGEIRDAETARIATEAALTGHLLLSTLHTNSAATTVTRLLELGVEAFLLKSTLLGVLAQRLARRNCPYCLVPDHHDQHIADLLGASGAATYVRGAGCAHCDGTGIAGRVAVYELLTVDAGLRHLIEPRANADLIHQHAVQSGMTTISQHALQLAGQGVISLTEAFRIHVD